MRSDWLDRLIGAALERPVRVSWRGGAAESLRGRFRSPSFEVQGVATAWLPLERIELRARSARLVPGLPARLAVEAPEVSITVGQADLDRWVGRAGLPFHLRLAESGVVVRTALAGVELSEIETRLEVVRGWFLLCPRRARVLGIPSAAAGWFRTYLPLPPLSPEARLLGIDHRLGALTLHIGVDGFEEALTPGLAGRLRRRLLPRWGG